LNDSSFPINQSKVAIILLILAAQPFIGYNSFAVESCPHSRNRFI